MQYAKSIEKHIKIKHIISGILLFLLIFSIWKTSGSQKYSVNTVQWGPGGWLMAKNSIEGYLWLKQNLPLNTEVFSFSTILVEQIQGFDMYSCDWCPDIMEFRGSTINKTPDEIHSFLKSRQYEYVIMDAHYAEKYGFNETNELISSLSASGLFQIVHQTQTTLTFKIL